MLVYLDDGCKDGSCNDVGGGAEVCESREVGDGIYTYMATRPGNSRLLARIVGRGSNGRRTGWKGAHSLHRWSRYRY